MKDTKLFNEIEFVEINNQHEDGIIDLLLITLPNKDKTTLKEQYKILNYENPIQNFKPIGIVAIHKNKIIAYRNFVALPYLFANKKVKILVPNNTVTHLNYRRKGILTEINKISFGLYSNKFSFFLNMSSNKYSMPANLKQKWLTLGEKDYLYKRFLGLTKSIEKNIKISFTQQVRSDIIVDIYKKSIFSNDLKIEIDLSSIEFVEWIFNRKDYQYAILKKDNISLAYCCYSINKKKCNLIHFDMVNQNYSISYLLNEIAKNNKITSFYYFGKKKKSLREIELLQAGFMSTNNLFIRRLVKKSLTPFLIRPTKENYGTPDFFVDGIDARLIDNWNITKLSNF